MFNNRHVISFFAALVNPDFPKCAVFSASDLKLKADDCLQRRRYICATEGTHHC